MEKEDLYKTVEHLDAQMPLVRVELNKAHTKMDKIDADQRKTMVLFEDTDGKFKLTLDAYIGLNVKMEHIEREVMELKERIVILETFVKEGFELLSRKFELLSGKLDQLARPAV